jgi:hypothetical protein
MLKVMGGLRLPVLVSMTCAIAALTVLVLAGSAFADHGGAPESPVLNGDWASFNRCPVDSPAMLEATGSGILDWCFAETSPSGSMTVGDLTVATKGSDHQIGLVENTETVSFAVVPPAGGALVAEPVELPGGLRELVCPGGGRFVRQVCGHHGGGWGAHADGVIWTIESAGAPYGFNLFAGLRIGLPVISMPVKIHLQSRVLGNDCYIGTDTEPIVLQGENLTLSPGESEGFDTNGTPDPNPEAEAPLLKLELHSTQGAGQFAVPAASGCGFRGIYDQAINSKVGLPSPAGKNTLVFDEASTSLALSSDPALLAPNEGKEFSKDWHSAILPAQPEGGHRHGSSHEPAGGGRRWSGHELEESIRHGFNHGR